MDDGDQDPVENSNVEPVFDRKILNILACPLTKGSLIYDDEKQELVSNKAQLAYPIKDGIPILIPEEARKIEI